MSARSIHRRATRHAGANLRSIGNVRRRLIREIKTKIEPHLWESGFVERDSKGAKCGHIRLWCDQKDGKPTDKTWKLGGYVVNEIHGITSDSLIVDASYMISTTPFECVPLEDLILVQRWVDQQFSS